MAPQGQAVAGPAGGAAATCKSTPGQPGGGQRPPTKGLGLQEVKQTLASDEAGNSFMQCPCEVKEPSDESPESRTRCLASNPSYSTYGLWPLIRDMIPLGLCPHLSKGSNVTLLSL